MTVKVDKKIKKNNRWYYYGAYTKDGKKIWYKKRGFATKREAQKSEYLFLEELEKEKVDVKLSELIESYKKFSKKKVKDSTYRKNSYVFNRLNKEFPNAWLSDLDRVTLQEFIDRLDDIYEKSYVEKIFYVMQSLFKYAIDMELLEENPLKRVQRNLRVNEMRKEQKFWEQQDFKKFIETIDDTTLKTLYMTLYFMGMRIGETMALQWSDIDFESDTITIRKTSGARDRFKNPPYTPPKTKNSYRTIKMPKILSEQMKLVLEEHQGYTDFLSTRFVFGYIRPLPTESVRRWFNNGIVEANIGKPLQEQIQQIRLHDLRHSHASYLINNMSNGFTDFDIANRLGDTVATLHNTYAHWFKKKDKPIVDFMDRDCIL